MYRKVEINDQANFYVGQIADVLERRIVVGVSVLWVAVGNIEFAIQENKTKPVGVIQWQ